MGTPRTIPNLYSMFTATVDAPVTKEERLDVVVDRLAVIIENQPAGRGKYDLEGSLDKKIRTMDAQLNGLFEDGEWFDNLKGEERPVQEGEVEKLAREALRSLLDAATIIKDAGDFIPEQGNSWLIENPDHSEKLGGARSLSVPALKLQIFNGIMAGVETINASDNDVTIKPKYAVNGFDDLFQDMDTFSVREINGQDIEVPKLIKALDPKKRV